MFSTHEAYDQRERDMEEPAHPVAQARHARYMATPYILECWRNNTWIDYGRVYKLAHAVKVADGFTQAIRVRHGGAVAYQNKAADALERSRKAAPLMQDKVIHYEADGDVLFAAD